MPEERWREIEVAIGLDAPCLSFRKRLFSYVKLILAQPNEPAFGNIGGPHVSGVRKRLRKLNTDVKRIAATLSEMHSQAAAGDIDADTALLLTRFYRLDSEDTPSESEALGQHLIRLSDVVDAAIHALPNSSGGASKDTTLEELVATLAVCYWNETGKKPTVSWNPTKHRYGGSFLNFVRASCQAFAPAYITKSNQALGKSIQRTLKKLSFSM